MFATLRVAVRARSVRAQFEHTDENRSKCPPPADDGAEEAGPILSDLPGKDVTGKRAVTVSTRQRGSKVLEYQSKKNAAPSARRRVVVLVSLVGVMTLTSALLLAIAPVPLTPQATSSLLAIDAPQSFDEVFDVPSVPIEAHRWNYIYIHHSAGTSGNAQSLLGNDSMPADHFVIGNGEGAADGEIQIGRRWNLQLGPGSVPGAESIVPSCISICLVGDFNQGRPTPTQQRQLVQLVNALQNRLHIANDRVSFYTQAASMAGIGSYFPANDFRKQIMP